MKAKMAKIKALAQQLMSLCEEDGEEMASEGTAPELSGDEDDMPEKSLKMKMAKYKV